MISPKVAVIYVSPTVLTKVRSGYTGDLPIAVDTFSNAYLATPQGRLKNLRLLIGNVAKRLALQ